ncbi:MAG: phosphotransferase [Cytophagaceae bacterium]|nr:phosphotransferase [Cytophagaceae bacterium]
MTTLPDLFKENFPNAYYLDAQHLDGLPDFLRMIHWIDPDETVLNLEKPGDGNMNFVLRVNTNRRSFILKQARPWVEKYPQVSAPAERVVTEARFYELVSNHPELQQFLPTLLGYDAENLLLALEDLGPNADFTALYRQAVVPDLEAVRSLIRFLSTLHSTNFGLMKAAFPTNQALKKVNHEHIFDFPYREENGFNLDTVQPGLQVLAELYKRDVGLKAHVHALGEMYLGTGTVLLHGDFYPGSWLHTKHGAKVIDPEFSYFGRPEYDVAVMTAHLKMARLDDNGIRTLLQTYQRPAGFDSALFAGFCGTEVLRRLIGLAQLPVDLSLPEKERLLAWGSTAISRPETVSFLN